MRHERNHIIGHESLVDAAIDALADRMLDRELTSDERASLQEHVRQRIESTTHQARTDGARTLAEKSVFTPPELARKWGVSPDKILAWIRSGELKATNVAQSQTGRPRYRIDAEAVREFKAKRANHSPTPVTRRRRRTSPDVIEFF